MEDDDDFHSDSDDDMDMDMDMNQIPERRIPEPNENGPQVCRICLGTELDGLISPCLCTGTAAYVHGECLREWIRATGRTKCSVCRFAFTVRRKSFIEYLKEKPHMILALICIILALCVDSVLLVNRAEILLRMAAEHLFTNQSYCALLMNSLANVCGFIKGYPMSIRFFCGCILGHSIRTLHKRFKVWQRENLILDV